MTHLAHLLRADVRRFKLPLAAWLLIQIIEDVYTGIRPGLAADPRLRPAVDLLGAVLWLARWLGLIVLVPLAVQAHPLVGSDAFWMTRPIGWRALLGSKLVLLGTTFVILPAVSEVVLMAACGIPFGQIGRVSLQTLLFGALWLVVIMAVSAVTRNLSRFALVVGSALVGFVLLINVVIAVLIRSMGNGPQLNPVTGRIQSSVMGLIVPTVVVIAAAGLQIVVQYRTRLTRASVAAGLTGLTAAVLAVAFWPSNQQVLPAPAWAHRQAALRVVAASPTGQFSLSLNGGNPSAASDEWQVGRARLRVTGVEPGWLPTIRLADSTAQFADGTALRTAENGDSSAVPIDSDDDAPSAVVTRHVLGVTRLWPSQGHDWSDAVPAIVVSQADFTRHEGATATYHGRFVVDLDQIQMVGTLPLHPGAEYSDSRRRLVIDRVVPQSQAVSLLIRQFSAASVFDGDTLPGLSLYLRNRIAAEAVTGEEQAVHVSTDMGLPSFFGTWGYSQQPGHGFRATGEFLRFPPYGMDHTGLDLGAAWVSGAELVLVHTVPAGSVMRTVEIPAFAFRPAPPRR